MLFFIIILCSILNVFTLDYLCCYTNLACNSANPSKTLADGSCRSVTWTVLDTQTDSQYPVGGVIISYSGSSMDIYSDSGCSEYLTNLPGLTHKTSCDTRYRINSDNSCWLGTGTTACEN
jgi:hypothetical protein